MQREREGLRVLQLSVEERIGTVQGMSGARDAGFPEFGRPPVIETVLGVHFEPIRGLTAAHLGLFWQRLGRHKWPTIRELAPIVAQVERFDVLPTTPFRFSFTEVDPPEIRLRLDSPTGREVVQVQPNLLQTHWTRDPETEYPRYTSTKAKFQGIWTAFNGFLSDVGLDSPTLVQWEVTYINRIPSGDLWQSPADWPSIFNGVLVPPPIPGGATESAMVRYHYRLDDDKGRLHADVRHVSGETGMPPSLNVTLTARGPIDGRAATDGDRSRAAQREVESGLDLGRAAVVARVRGYDVAAFARALGVWGGGF